MRCGIGMSWAAMAAMASARPLGQGTVGPEATCAGSSPGTSDTISDTTRAGAAAAARRPPFTAETCLRMAFIAEIGAPDDSNAVFSACSSSGLRPSGGAASRAEPPPVISATTRSSSVSPASRVEDARRGGLACRIEGPDGRPPSTSRWRQGAA